MHMVLINDSAHFVMFYNMYKYIINIIDYMAFVYGKIRRKYFENTSTLWMYSSSKYWVYHANSTSEYSKICTEMHDYISTSTQTLELELFFIACLIVYLYKCCCWIDWTWDSWQRNVSYTCILILYHVMLVWNICVKNDKLITCSCGIGDHEW